jgi:hypothetical protein
MIVKKNKLTDDDITQYCQSVNKLLASINERSVAKKGKKPVEIEEEEDYTASDEDVLVLS